MNWFFLALCCAFLTACCDALSKRVMTELDEWLTGTAILGIASVLLIPVFVRTVEAPVSSDLLLLLAMTLPLEILAYYLFLSAIRMAPISLTVPLLALTPVLTVVSSALMLGETISAAGAGGIVLVTVGAYVLNGDLLNQSFFAPIKAVVSNPGSRRMLGVAVIWSVTSALGKKGVLLFGAIPFGCILLFGVVIAFALIASYKICRGSACSCKPDWRLIALFAAGGLLMAGAEITHFLAISMAPVAYMISVKRLSLVFGVMWGWLFFKERNIGYRVVGASLMVGGIFFIYQ
jgi:drug/metabolite transporter (DMT)-like permease